MNISQGAHVNNVPDMNSNCDTHNCICSQPGSHVNTMRKAECTDLIIAAKTGCTECVKNMIQSGTDVNQADNSNYTALMYAAQNGHSDCVNILIESRS